MVTWGTSILGNLHRPARLAGLATGLTGLTGLTGAAPAGLALGPRRIRDKKRGEKVGKSTLNQKPCEWRFIGGRRGDISNKDGGNWRDLKAKMEFVQKPMPVTQSSAIPGLLI